MSIKTSKRIALGVITALVFAPFAAIAPASADPAVTAVSVAAPGTGRVGSVFTSLVSVVTAAGAVNETLTLRARFEERPATSTAVVGFSSAGLTMVDDTAGAATLLTAAIAGAGAAGNELLPARVVLSPAAGKFIAAAAVDAALGKAGSVGFIPDVAGTYKVLVWNDVNGDGLVGAAESKSAVITFTVGNAPASVKVTSLSGTGVVGLNALVKLQLLDAAGAVAGLASNESITLTSSSAETDFAFINGVGAVADVTQTLTASSFVKGVSYIGFHDDAAAGVTATMTIAGVGGSVTALSGTFTQKFVALAATTAGTTVMTTGTSANTAATFTVGSTNNGVTGSITATVIPLATKTLTYLTTATAAAGLTDQVIALTITDIAGHVTGKAADGIAANLVFTRAVPIAAATTTAVSYTGTFSIAVTSPIANVNQFSATTVLANNTGNQAIAVATGPINDGVMTVVAPSGAISLQTGSSITYTVNVKDNFGRNVPNASVARTGGTRNLVATAPTAVTDAAGNASFTVADAPAAGVTSLTDAFIFTSVYVGGTSTVTASAITWSATALAVGTVALATPTTLDVAPAITYSDINAGATGAQATVVTVSATVKDASGNLLAGVPVTFTTADTGAAVLTTTATGYTSAAGVATASVYGWRTGIKTFTATAGGIAGTGTVNFNQQTATEARTVSAALVGKLATVTVKDRFGNTIEGVNILGTRTGTGYFGTGSTSATGTTDKNGEASFVVEGVGTFKFSATTTLGVENLEFGQTSAIKGNAVGALATGVLTATVAGTAIKAETGVGASFDAAGANSATVTTTAPVAPAVVVPPVVYDNPTLSFVKDGSRVILSGTAVDGEGDIIIYTKKVGTTAWKERAKTLEVAAPGDFNGSIKAPKSNVLIRVKQEGTGQFSNQVIVLK